MNLMQAMNDYTYFFANFALSDHYFFNATYDHTIFTESSINDSPLGSYNSIIYTIGLNNNINDMRILEAQCPTYSSDIKILMLDFRYNMFEWGNEYLRDQEILSVCRPNRRILRDELDAACWGQDWWTCDETQILSYQPYWGYNFSIVEKISNLFGPHRHSMLYPMGHYYTHVLAWQRWGWRVNLAGGVYDMADFKALRVDCNWWYTLPVLHDYLIINDYNLPLSNFIRTCYDSSDIDFKLSNALIALNCIYNYTVDSMLNAYYYSDIKKKYLFIFIYYIHSVIFIFITAIIYWLTIKGSIYSYYKLESFTIFIKSYCDRDIYLEIFWDKVDSIECRIEYLWDAYIAEFINTVLIREADLVNWERKWSAYTLKVDTKLANLGRDTKRAKRLADLKELKNKLSYLHTTENTYFLTAALFTQRLLFRTFWTFIIGICSYLIRSFMRAIMFYSRIYGLFYIIFFYIYWNFYKFRRFVDLAYIHRFIWFFWANVKNQLLIAFFFSSNYHFARATWSYLPVNSCYYTTWRFFYNYPHEHDPSFYKIMYKLRPNPTFQYQAEKFDSMRNKFILLYSFLYIILYIISTIYFYCITNTRNLLEPVSTKSRNIYLWVRLGYLSMIHNVIYLGFDHNEYYRLFTNWINGMLLFVISSALTILYITSVTLVFIANSIILNTITLFCINPLIIFVVINVSLNLISRLLIKSFNYSLIIWGLFINIIISSFIFFVKLLYKIIFYIIWKLRYILFLYILYLTGFNFTLLLDLLRLIVETPIYNFISILDDISEFWFQTYGWYRSHEDPWSYRALNGTMIDLYNIGWFQEWMDYSNELERLRSCFWIYSGDLLYITWLPNIFYWISMWQQGYLLLCLFDFLYNYPVAYLSCWEPRLFCAIWNDLTIVNYFTKYNYMWLIYPIYWYWFDYFTHFLWLAVGREWLIEVPMEYGNVFCKIYYGVWGPRIFDLKYRYYSSENLIFEFISDAYWDYSKYTENKYIEIARYSENNYIIEYHKLYYQLVREVYNIYLKSITFYNWCYYIISYDILRCIINLYDWYYMKWFSSWYVYETAAYLYGIWYWEAEYDEGIFENFWEDLWLVDYVHIALLMLEDILDYFIHVDLGHRDKMDLLIGYITMINIKMHINIIDFMQSYMRIDPKMLEKYKITHTVIGACDYSRWVTNIDTIEPLDSFGSIFDPYGGASFNDLYFLRLYGQKPRLYWGVNHTIAENLCIFTCRSSFIAIYYSLSLYIYILYMLFRNFIVLWPFSKLVINPGHLWMLFRREGLSKNKWLDNKEDAEIRDFYTLTKTNRDELFEKSLSKRAYKINKDFITKITEIKSHYNYIFNQTMDLFEEYDMFSDFRPMKARMRRIKFRYKGVMRRIKKRYEKLSLIQRLRVSNNVREILDNEYDITVKFEYKRFLIDPEFETFYNIRVSEPTKLEILIAMGLRYNIYLKAIYEQEQTIDFHTDFFEHKWGSDLVLWMTKAYNYFSDLDKILYDGFGPIWLYNQQQSTEFLVYDKSLGERYYSITNRVNSYDSPFILILIYPIYLLLNVYIDILGFDWTDFSPVNQEIDFVTSLITCQFKSLYNVGMVNEMMFQRFNTWWQMNPGSQNLDIGTWRDETLYDIHPLFNYFNELKHDLVNAKITIYSNDGLWSLYINPFHKTFDPNNILYTFEGFDPQNKWNWLVDYFGPSQYTNDWRPFHIFYMIFSLIVTYKSYKAGFFSNDRVEDVKKINYKVLSSWLTIDRISALETFNNMYLKYYYKQYKDLYVKYNKGKYSS